MAVVDQTDSELAGSWASTSGVRRSMQSNKSAGTRPEMALRSALHAVGLRYRVNQRLSVGVVRVRPDVVFTRARVCVFSDGCFWHGCPRHATDPKTNVGYWAPKLRANLERDALVNDALVQAGWLVARVWEHHDASDAAAGIGALVSSRASGRSRAGVLVRYGE